MEDLNLYLKNYVNNLSKSILNLDNNELKKATKLILGKIKKNNTIFVCGNGGSAAIANHYVCDYIKFFRDRTEFKPKIISLSNNLETITAIANDISYTLVPPKTWQKEMFLGIPAIQKAKSSANDTKAMALIAAKRLFPEDMLKTNPKNKPHDGIVDALLISEYACRTNL